MERDRRRAGRPHGHIWRHVGAHYWHYPRQQAKAHRNAVWWRWHSAHGNTIRRRWRWWPGAHGNTQQWRWRWWHSAHTNATCHGDAQADANLYQHAIQAVLNATPNSTLAPRAPVHRQSE